MIFGTHHYVPVLKMKRGEKGALRAIAPSLRPRITPLLEIVERTKPTVGKHLDTAFINLAESLQGYQRCFLDAREIALDGRPAAEEVFNRADAAGISFTPVTGVTRTEDVAAALSYKSNGVALRLIRQEFENGLFPSTIRKFMDTHGLTPEETDLIIDLGPVDNFVTEGIIGLTDAFLLEVPNHMQWRTFTISACAFPSSMGVVQRNSYMSVDRMEWIAWRDNLYPNTAFIPRLPTFSDCAIQHTIGVEGFDPRMMQVSASVRYTLTGSWLLIKGESTRNIPAKEQFLALATQLVYGTLRNFYMGPDHCDGCASMKNAADGAPSLGSAEAWRRLGTIHHIATVTQELESLSLP